MDLVGEKQGYDGEKSIDDIIELADDVKCDRWHCEELKGEVFDGGFGFTVHEEVGVDDPVVNVDEM